MKTGLIIIFTLWLNSTFCQKEGADTVKISFNDFQQMVKSSMDSIKRGHYKDLTLLSKINLIRQANTIRNDSLLYTKSLFASFYNIIMHDFFTRLASDLELELIDRKYFYSRKYNLRFGNCLSPDKFVVIY